MTIKELREHCDFTVNELYFFVDHTDHSQLKVYVEDGRNNKNKAELVCKDLNNPYLVKASTFKDGKRKYEMLYISEINKRKAYDILYHKYCAKKVK